MKLLETATPDGVNSVSFSNIDLDGDALFIRSNCNFSSFGTLIFTVNNNTNRDYYSSGYQFLRDGNQTYQDRDTEGLESVAAQTNAVSNWFIMNYASNQIKHGEHSSFRPSFDLGRVVELTIDETNPITSIQIEIENTSTTFSAGSSIQLYQITAGNSSITTTG